MAMWWRWSQRRCPLPTLHGWVLYAPAARANSAARAAAKAATALDPVTPVAPVVVAWRALHNDGGHKRVTDFNGAEQDGVGYYQVTQKDQRRWSTASAYHN